MNLILDASMALAWCITRSDPSEAALAQDALNFVRLNSAQVPALWYSEVLNALLVFERAKRLSPQDSTNFLIDLATLWIDQDSTPVAGTQSRLLTAARKYQLTAYDATYLELAQRKSASLATFDRQLAQACRNAGIHVFGDS
jgi:predicted nucleic acid-binding protein